MKESKTLLEYYRENKFNPVPISLENKDELVSHFAKRKNLYQNHLGIPLVLLKGASVLEFGCNSGENSLVLASSGADLTLVEPNEQVLPLLRSLFNKNNLSERVVELRVETIQEFATSQLYDLVVAEGFLFDLPDRDEMFSKIVGFIKPYGLGIISFIDKYGGLMEWTKKAILWRACQLSGIDDIESDASLKIAERLFGQDYSRLKASRPFEAWWKDTLVNPLAVFSSCWSYLEILSKLENLDCEFYSSSPKWVFMDQFKWYKNVSSSLELKNVMLEQFASVFPYFLTGIPITRQSALLASGEVIESFSNLTHLLLDYSQARNPLINPVSVDSIEYPVEVADYLDKYPDPGLQTFNKELKEIINMLKEEKLEEFINYYRSTSISGLWGTPYHYICFQKYS